MDFITLTPETIETEHICCAITEKKGENCVASKKAWLKDRMQEGLVFRRLDARGKVFIEYLPAEQAWCPVEAENYMFINCFWVSGQFKGKGLGDELLEQCIADAKTKKKSGLVILSSKKKMPFLSDPRYLRYKGFQLAGQAAPWYELLYLPFDSSAPAPQFKDCAKAGHTDEPGLVLYYTDQCPHTAKYAPLFAQMAEERGVAFKLIRLTSGEDARNAPCPFTTYSLFADGTFVTNEILSEKKITQLLEQRMG